MSTKFGVFDRDEALLGKAYKGILTSTLATTKKQKDIFLNEEEKTINFTNNDWTEISFLLYKDGLFSLSNVKQKCEIIINLNYKFIENINHLPFYIQVMIGGSEIFINSYGHFNETNVYINLIADVSLTMLPKFYVKKMFNDNGSLRIHKNSFMVINSF